MASLQWQEVDLSVVSSPRNEIVPKGVYVPPLYGGFCHSSTSAFKVVRDEYYCKPVVPSRLRNEIVPIRDGEVSSRYEVEAGGILPEAAAAVPMPITCVEMVREPLASKAVQTMIETINDIIDNGAPDSDINALRAWKADLPMKKFVEVDALIRRLHQCPHKNISVLNAQSKADADNGEFRALGGKTYAHRGYPSMSNPSRDEAPGRPWASYGIWLQASVMLRSVTSRDTVPPEQTPYDTKPEPGPKRFV